MRAFSLSLSHLTHLVSQCQKSSGPGKEVTPEVDAQPIAHDRNTVLIDKPRQLPDLLFREKLRLVDEDARETLRLQVRRQPGEEVVLVLESVRGHAQADPRAYFTLAGARIQSRRQQDAGHTSLDVVMCRLQQHRALACVHCAIVEVKLAHCFSIAFLNSAEVQWCGLVE